MPDISNIMSYSGDCSENFTPGQGVRMRNAINNSSVLQEVRSAECSVPFVGGDSVVCHNDSTTLTVMNGDPPYSWSVSQIYP